MLVLRSPILLLLLVIQVFSTKARSHPKTSGRSRSIRINQNNSSITINTFLDDNKNYTASKVLNNTNPESLMGNAIKAVFINPIDNSTNTYFDDNKNYTASTVLNNTNPESLLENAIHPVFMYTVLNNTNGTFLDNINETIHNNTNHESTLENCSCNGAIDEVNLGKCSKETTWCYVDPEAPCTDAEVWLGQFGFGWKISFEACENHLAEVHKEECAVIQESFDEKTDDKECSCNGEFDDVFGGECQSPWSGKLWCYVDRVGSGCEDAQVWYGEFGFCQTYSFQACQGYDHGPVQVEYNYNGDYYVENNYYDESALKN